MRLVSVQIQKFRNFDASGEVNIQPDVTALVGKNESGKTAFLHGLHRLNPIDGKKFNELDHYPRWMYTKDRKEGGIPDVSPVKAMFEMATTGNVAAMAHYAGQSVGMVRSRQPAAEIVRELVEGADRLLAQWA